MVGGIETETVHRAADMFSILGNETRVNILLLLADDEYCVHDIADELDMELSNISHHLRRMRDTGIAQARKDGRHKYYSVKDEHIQTLVETGVECASE
ncbi:MAG: metalloregulator ArsR/SmtB family transcription factor [Candidatus Nanohaloarchaea archaeon]|nr:metalloregulator ArsR/SmtB family transcription factor [Candidatus Nanohaloarchaea archaeon]